MLASCWNKHNLNFRAQGTKRILGRYLWWQMNWNILLKIQQQSLEKYLISNLNEIGGKFKTCKPQKKPKKGACFHCYSSQVVLQFPLGFRLLGIFWNDDNPVVVCYAQPKMLMIVSRIHPIMTNHVLKGTKLIAPWHCICHWGAENIDQLLEEKLNDSDDCSRMKNSFRDFINSSGYFFSCSKSNLQLSSLVMATVMMSQSWWKHSYESELFWCDFF